MVGRVNFNYISNGKWYINNSNDIHKIHSLLLSFYDDTLKSLYGKSKKCRLIYDKDLQLLILKNYGVKRIFNKSIKIFLNYTEGIYKRIKLLFESIVATGVVNAPFYRVDISFSTDVSGKSDYIDSGYVYSASKFGVANGYFSLVGRIL